MADPIFNLLHKGVAEVIKKENLEKKLRSGKKLRVKLGIDPTGADLHLGHMVPLKKLRQFQDLGHEVYLIIGNFTGKIGDPSGRIEEREPLSDKEVRKNAATYLKQASKVLDLKRLKVVYNADWLSKLNFEDVIRLASQFTVAQLLERDMFQERMKKDLPISLHEFLYPLMQGYDSVYLKADVEVGGTDQTFNLLSARPLQIMAGQQPQDIITVPILEGLDGKRKMSKTYENYIGVLESPKEMYGKIMSLPDESIIRYFELCTDLSLEEIEKLKRDLKRRVNPRDLKMRLGKEVVTFYHDGKKAKQAEATFVKIFQNKEFPQEIPERVLNEKNLRVTELLFKTGLTSSKGEARRLIEGGGVKINGNKIKAIDREVKMGSKGILLQIGRRKFLRVKAR